VLALANPVSWLAGLVALGALAVLTVTRRDDEAGTVLALAAAHVCGALALGPQPRPGVHGLAGLVDPVRFLAELTTRGVRAAAFEGVPVA
jgi:hypothetical protein